MSDQIAQTELDLSVNIPNSEILTKEIGQDIFDGPPKTPNSVALKEIQEQRETNSGDMSKKEGVGSKVVTDFSQVLTSSAEQDGARLDNSFWKVEDYYDELSNESGRCSPNMKAYLEVDQISGLGLVSAVPYTETEADFYSIRQGNATGPNYPRPQQCCHNSIMEPLKLNGDDRSMGQMLYPINSGDCDLGGIFADDEMTSSSSNGASLISTDSDLTDSSEPELEFLESDDEEFVNIFRRHVDWIETDSDSSSDLTSVSSLSSLASTPDGSSVGAAVDKDTAVMLGDLNLATANDICSSPTGNNGFHAEEISSPKAELRTTGCGKPKKPLLISATESIIIPHDEMIGQNFAEDYDQMLMMQFQNVQSSNEIIDAFGKPEAKMMD